MPLLCWRIFVWLYNRAHRVRPIVWRRRCQPAGHALRVTQLRIVARDPLMCLSLCLVHRACSWCGAAWLSLLWRDDRTALENREPYFP